MATASKPVAKVLAAPPYLPELEAYGLRLDNGAVVPVHECPDRLPREIMRDPKALVDARLWEGRFERGRLRESRITDRLDKQQLHGHVTRLRETLKLREDDGWNDFAGVPYYGTGTSAPESALTSNFVPLIPGPATRQQYWADYWASSAKCFEASTHSGIARRACRAMVQFTLGRGVRWRIENEQAQQAWEAFWKGNQMRRRIRSIDYDLSVFGEQMLRYFPAARGDPRLLIVRQLDPATIYEIVTDQEDVETVFFYHQQFQTRAELYSPPTANRAPQGPTPSGVTRYIIRQIDAREIDHWKINAVAGEARGRSDLFPVLGDLKRLRDLLTGKVIQTDIGNRVMAILKANGTAADVSRLLNTIFPNGQPPPPGSIVGLNDAADLVPFQYTSGREVRADFTYDELLDSICAGVGISRPYLGLSPSPGSGTTRASSLVTVEPDVKSFEERRDLLDEMLHQMFDRVMAKAGINGEIEREFIFPAITKEDRSAKLEDIEAAEADGYLSKRTAATLAAAEFDLTDYDFDEETEQIIEEFKDSDSDGQGGKIRRPMINARNRQAPKLDPTDAQQLDDEPMGELVASGTGATARGAAGMPASQNPASASNTIRKRESLRNRRMPDDPEAAKADKQFQRQTQENLRRLLADLDDRDETTRQALKESAGAQREQAQAITRLAAAVSRRRDPNVTIEKGAIQVSSPDVQVDPKVMIAEGAIQVKSPDVQVDVHVPEPGSRRQRIKRGADGTIKEIITEPPKR